MRFLGTRTNANEVHKDKIKGKLCCKAQEQRKMRLLGTSTSVNEVAKHQNKSKRGFGAKRLLSTRTTPIEDVKLTDMGK